jgi:hypothetical protein
MHIEQDIAGEPNRQGLDVSSKPIGMDANGAVLGLPV